MLCSCFGARLRPKPVPEAELPAPHGSLPAPASDEFIAKQDSDAVGPQSLGAAIRTDDFLLSLPSQDGRQRAAGDEIMQTTASIRDSAVPVPFNLDSLISQLRASHSPLPVGAARRSSVASIGSSQMPTLKLPDGSWAHSGMLHGTGELGDVITGSMSQSGHDFSFADPAESAQPHTATLFKQARGEDSQRLRHETIHEGPEDVPSNLLSLTSQHSRLATSSRPDSQPPGAQNSQTSDVLAVGRPHYVPSIGAMGRHSSALSTRPASAADGDGEMGVLRRVNSISNGEAMRGMLLDGQQEKQRRELAAAAKIMSAVLDDVQVLKVLGSGAHGRVYKALWQGRLVAVKVVNHEVDAFSHGTAPRNVLSRPDSIQGRGSVGAGSDGTGSASILERRGSGFMGGGSRLQRQRSGRAPLGDSLQDSVLTTAAVLGLSHIVAQPVSGTPASPLIPAPGAAPRAPASAPVSISNTADHSNPGSTGTGIGSGQGFAVSPPNTSSLQRQASQHSMLQGRGAGPAGVDGTGVVAGGVGVGAGAAARALADRAEERRRLMEGLVGVSARHAHIVQTFKIVTQPANGPDVPALVITRGRDPNYLLWDTTSLAPTSTTTGYNSYTAASSAAALPLSMSREGASAGQLFHGALTSGTVAGGASSGLAGVGCLASGSANMLGTLSGALAAPRTGAVSGSSNSALLRATKRSISVGSTSSRASPSDASAALVLTSPVAGLPFLGAGAHPGSGAGTAALHTGLIATAPSTIIEDVREGLTTRDLQGSAIGAALAFAQGPTASSVLGGASPSLHSNEDIVALQSPLLMWPIPLPAAGEDTAAGQEGTGSSGQSWLLATSTANALPKARMHAGTDTASVQLGAAGARSAPGSGAGAAPQYNIWPAHGTSTVQGQGQRQVWGSASQMLAELGTSSTLQAPMVRGPPPPAPVHVALVSRPSLFSNLLSSMPNMTAYQRGGILDSAQGAGRLELPAGGGPSAANHQPLRGMSAQRPRARARAPSLEVPISLVRPSPAMHQQRLAVGTTGGSARQAEARGDATSSMDNALALPVQGGASNEGQLDAGALLRLQLATGSTDMSLSNLMNVRNTAIDSESNVQREAANAQTEWESEAQLLYTQTLSRLADLVSSLSELGSQEGKSAAVRSSVGGLTGFTGTGAQHDLLSTNLSTQSRLTAGTNMTAGSRRSIGSAPNNMASPPTSLPQCVPTIPAGSGLGAGGMPQLLEGRTPEDIPEEGSSLGEQSTRHSPAHSSNTSTVHVLLPARAQGLPPAPSSGEFSGMNAVAGAQRSQPQSTGSEVGVAAGERQGGGADEDDEDWGVPTGGTYQGPLAFSFSSRTSLFGGGGGVMPGRHMWRTYIVQEFCTHGCLREALVGGAFHRPVPERGVQVVAIGALLATELEVARALGYLHTKRLVHGDLKTANVMLQGADPAVTSGRGFTAKLGDFGLARMLGPQATVDVGNGDTGGGEAGLLVSKYGTVSHCPPETLRDNLVMLASDVYSFGVMMWELYCVDQPFAGYNAFQLMNAVVAEGEKLVFPPHCPPPYAQLAHDCMAPDPKARPTMQVVAARIEGLLGHHHHRAHPQQQHPPHSRHHGQHHVGNTAVGTSHYVASAPTSSGHGHAQSVLTQGPLWMAHAPPASTSSGVAAAAAVSVTSASASPGSAPAVAQSVHLSVVHPPGPTQPGRKSGPYSAVAAAGAAGVVSQQDHQQLQQQYAVGPLPALLEVPLPAPGTRRLPPVPLISPSPLSSWHNVMSQPGAGFTTGAAAAGVQDGGKYAGSYWD